MNILIIGLGSIAKKHIDALRALKVEAKLYALRSNLNGTDEEGVENIYSIENFDKIFDFAIISNPTYLHYEFIKMLACKGIPLFIEKPAVHSLENIESLLSVIRKRDLITYVACNLRFHPCITFLKNKLDADSVRINEVNVYCGSYLPDWRPGQDFRKSYSANSEMGGGVHLDLFHELDYTYWLFGEPNSLRSFKRSVSSLSIKAIDYANYILEYDNYTLNIILNYYRRDPKRIIEIVTDDTTLIVDLINNSISNSNGDLIFKADKNFTLFDTYISQMIFFIEGLKSNLKQMNTFEDSAQVLKFFLKDE
jgi:predicted dehydrogenase